MSTSGKVVAGFKMTLSKARIEVCGYCDPMQTRKWWSNYVWNNF